MAEGNAPDTADIVARCTAYLSVRPVDGQTFHAMHPEALIHEAAETIDRLREDCAQAYQVVGHLAATAGVFGHPQTVKALDNLHAAANGDPRPHEDLIPFAVGIVAQ